MGIRDAIGLHPKVAAAGAATMTGLLVLIIFWQSAGSRIVAATAHPGKVFFTVDDGATTFVDENTKLAPFDHDGKEAVKAYVFRCGDTKFVGYLERYSRESLEKIKNARKDPNFELEMIRQIRPDVKKPGQGNWVNSSSPDARAILDVKCPDGKSDGLETVMP